MKTEAAKTIAAYENAVNNVHFVATKNIFEPFLVFRGRRNELR